MNKIEERFAALMREQFGEGAGQAIVHLQQAGIIHTGNARRYVIAHEVRNRIANTTDTPRSICIMLSQEMHCDERTVRRAVVG